MNNNSNNKAADYQAHSLPLITLTTSTIPTITGKDFIIASFIDGKDPHINQFFPFVEALCSLGYKFMINFSNISSDFEKSCIKLQEQFPEQFHFSETGSYSESVLSKSADAFFSLSYPSKKDVKWLVEKGIVPVVPNNGIFVNFNSEAESGNGFTFEEGNFWRMFEAIIRARETRKFSYDWRNIRQAVRKTVV